MALVGTVLSPAGGGGSVCLGHHHSLSALSHGFLELGTT